MYDVIIYDTLTSYTAIAMGVHTMTAITATILSSLLLLSSPSTTAVAFLVPHPLFSANNNVIVPRPSSSTKLNIDRRASFCPALGMLPAGGATAWADAAHAILAAGGEDASVSSAADLVASPSAAATLLLSDAGQGLDDTTKLGLAAFAGVGVAAAGFKTAVYWRMQYVVSFGYELCVTYRRDVALSSSSWVVKIMCSSKSDEVGVGFGVMTVCVGV